MNPDRVRVAGSRGHFIRSGSPFFYLADTVWSAFTSATMSEWAQYLEIRAQQGFNVLQINVLPQWDRSVPDLGIAPFAVRGDGRFDFTLPRSEYFDRADEMLEAAVGHGFVPALVMLWGDYVPGTWLAEAYPDHVLPPEELERYVTDVATRFRKHGPIWLVSGDISFGTVKVAQYCAKAMRLIRAADPEALLTLHLMGLPMTLPRHLVKSQNLDFYMYQSGHFREQQHEIVEYSKRFLGEVIARPIVNGEPCYEGISIDIPRPERAHPVLAPPITGAEVRRAMWLSLLSGAAAGVAYGAHGVWCWHDAGRRYLPSDPRNGTPYYGNEPLSWRRAVQLDGPGDAEFARRIFETHGLFGVKPAPEVFAGPDGIRVAASSDRSRVAAYLPEGDGVSMAEALWGWRWRAFDLSTRSEVDVRPSAGALALTGVRADAVLVGHAP